jgi:hypothetical protein
VHNTIEIYTEDGKMTEIKYFATEEGQKAFYNSLKDVNFKMRSPFIPNNPKGKQWGVQWS